METKEKRTRELYLEFQELDQNIKQLQKHLEVVTQQLIELSTTSNSLNEFVKIDTQKDVFIPLSTGIYAKAVIKNTSELLVNVGSNVVVKKDIASTKELVQKQFEELKKIQKQIIENLDEMSTRAAKIEKELQELIPES